jgi:hypothetical protein
MKKIFFLSFCTICALTMKTSGQHSWPNYKGYVRMTGMIEKEDTGNHHIHKNVNASLRTQGAYGHIGYGVNYNYLQKTLDLNLGYAVLRKNGEIVTLFSTGPAVRINPSTNTHKQKDVFLGGFLFMDIEREKSFEVELNTSYVGKLKNQQGEWNESHLIIDIEAIKKIVPVFGIGMRLGYKNSKLSEPKSKDPNYPYWGEVSNKSTSEAGIFANLEIRAFSFNIGTELSRERYSYKDIDTPKVWEAGGWMLNWRANLTYKFNYFKKHNYRNNF